MFSMSRRAQLGFCGLASVFLAVGIALWAAASGNPDGPPPGIDPVAAAPVPPAAIPEKQPAAAVASGGEKPAAAAPDPVPRSSIQDGVIMVSQPDGSVIEVPIPDPFDENKPVPDTAFFIYAGAFGVGGGRTGLQSTATRDKLGVHEDVVRDHANLGPAFDAIFRDGENRLAYYRKNEGAPCEGGHWEVLVEKVVPADGGGWEIQVSAGHSCQPGGMIWIDGGMSEVWTVAPGSTMPALKSRAVTGASFGFG